MSPKKNVKNTYLGQRKKTEPPDKLEGNKTLDISNESSTSMVGR